MKTVKTYLLENDGLITDRLLKWVKGFDPDFKEINTSGGRDYMRSQDLRFFGLLINPNIDRLITSSSFPSQMPYEAFRSFNKDFDDNGDGFYQLEYFSWLIREAVNFRKGFNIQPIIIELNYEGEGFLKHLKDNYWGENTTSWVMLMMRQSEGFVKINLYEDYKFIETIITEDDLKLD